MKRSPPVPSSRTWRVDKVRRHLDAFRGWHPSSCGRRSDIVGPGSERRRRRRAAVGWRPSAGGAVPGTYRAGRGRRRRRRWRRARHDRRTATPDCAAARASRRASRRRPPEIQPRRGAVPAPCRQRCRWTWVCRVGVVNYRRTSSLTRRRARPRPRTLTADTESNRSRSVYIGQTEWRWRWLASRRDGRVADGECKTVPPSRRARTCPDHTQRPRVDQQTVTSYVQQCNRQYGNASRGREMGRGTQQTRRSGRVSCAPPVGSGALCILSLKKRIWWRRIYYLWHFYSTYLKSNLQGYLYQVRCKDTAEAYKLWNSPSFHWLYTYRCDRHISLRVNL